jgi:D-arabinose 1-dehydrogenase-like Zn-dependent alcohol dehydrogenase
VWASAVAARPTVGIGGLGHMAVQYAKAIVGTCKDLEEALMFAGEGKVRTHFTTDRLESINDIFGAMRRGAIDGRVVLPSPREIGARPSGGEGRRRVVF